MSIDVAARVNDEMTEAISRHPDRFAGFATLAFADPKGSAVELKRAVTSLGLKGVLVNGIQDGGRFLDDPFFWLVLETAEALGVPIYLHPAEAPHAVFKAYYSGLKPGQAELLATSGWGWHVETGLHALRLIIAGVFVRFPTLQVVIGHDGEAIPFFLDRASDKLTKISRLPKSVADYFVENFYVTTSGMFTYPPLLCLLQTVGADRVIFSVDYPYGSTDEARRVLGAGAAQPGGPREGQPPERRAPTRAVVPLVPDRPLRRYVQGGPGPAGRPRSAANCRPDVPEIHLVQGPPHSALGPGRGRHAAWPCCNAMARWRRRVRLLQFS